MKFTAATWNMDHWKRTPAQRREGWQRLKDDGFDLALLQETVPPADLPKQDFVWQEIGRKLRFGSAVVSLKGWPIEEITTAKSPYSFETFRLTETFPGSVAVARVHPPDALPITVVSLYAVIDVYSTTTLLRQIADLIPLFDSVYGDRVVLGGDFNISTQRTDRNLPRYEAIFHLLESLGLVNLFCCVKDRPPALSKDCKCKREDCYHVTTHRNAASFEGPGWHLDYLFASRPLAARCNRLWLDDADEIWGMSDHCPVAVQMEIEETTGPVPWGERFASEVVDMLRAVLSEPAEWGRWTPKQGVAHPKVGSDRSLCHWLSVFLEGKLADGQVTQLELGIWRVPEKTGYPLVAHAGLLGKPMTERVVGVDLVVPPDSPAKIIEGQCAHYIVVPCQSDMPSESEIRKALTALLSCLQG